MTLWVWSTGFVPIEFVPIEFVLIGFEPIGFVILFLSLYDHMHF